MCFSSLSPMNKYMEPLLKIFLQKHVAVLLLDFEEHTKSLRVYARAS